jgi:hypothetical protein
LAEYLASKPPWIPKVWMDLAYIDPVLEKDGCVWTDPGPYRMKIKCVGNPDPNDPNTIILYDGRRLPVNTHLWIRQDKDSGTLITQRQEEIAQLDGDTAKKAILVQQIVSWWKSQKSTTPRCPPRSILEEASRSNIFAGAEVGPAVPGLAAGEWIAIADACGIKAAVADRGLPPVMIFANPGRPVRIPTLRGNAHQATDEELAAQAKRAADAKVRVANEEQARRAAEFDARRALEEQSRRSAAQGTAEAEKRPRVQRMEPDSQASGEHITFVRDPKTNKVYKYQQWDKDGMPVKRADVGSNSSQPAPHTHYPAGQDHMHSYAPPNQAPDGRLYPGKEQGARNLEPHEIPK